MYQIRTIFLAVVWLFVLGGCISVNNETVEGAGTPDISECVVGAPGCIAIDNDTNQTIDPTDPNSTDNYTLCSTVDGVYDGRDFVPRTELSANETDSRLHPDIFYIGWTELNDRIDLRFPEKGYDEGANEDKLFVSRKNKSGGYDTWQIYPRLDANCKDTENVKIHSFDVAPDGKSLFVSMTKEVYDATDTGHVNNLNPNQKLGIYKLDIASQELTPLTHDYSVSYTYPTYIGNDNQTGHEMLLISKTVTKADIPMNYKTQPTLQDEYDRASTPLIHTLDTVTHSVTRIGFNNSHQTEATVINRDDAIPLVVFTQWEHQATVNRFSLWKMQIDGSDNFMFFGQEADTKAGSQNLYQPRQIKSGPYKDYILMGQAGRTGNSGAFLAEGDIIMAKRDNLDLRSQKIYLSKTKDMGDVEMDIARTPEHYNDESFIYAYRESNEGSYKIYIKDYPSQPDATMDESPGELVLSSDRYHFMQPRSFYPPISKKVAPGTSDLSENRFSFTNVHLGGNSGFVVNTLGFSSNGVQHQLNGINTDDVRMQFQIPSHHFSDSYAIGLETSQELSIPSSEFIKPESDGSMGVILKAGLYIWKLHKKFPFVDGANESGNIWIPIRVERQEVSFVANRVNECNQCHQDRNQDIIDKYKDYHSIAGTKMRGNLADLIDTENDISDYNATVNIPDYHKNIYPLFTKPAVNGGQSCVSCHNATDKLNLSNATGIDVKNLTYRTLVLGAHKVPNSTTILPYLYGDVNPMGMDDDYHPAPFLWSLLLGNDLTVPEDGSHPNSTSRNLERVGDYGAEFSDEVNNEITRINGSYDHSKHWSLADTQALIEYSSNRLAVGLSNKISFVPNHLSTETPQAQKAYQALVRNCFSCHNNHTVGGLNDSSFESIIPKEKSFSNSYYLKDSTMRFSVYSHLANKGDTKYSQYLWQSNLSNSRARTLGSALYRVDFDDIDNSELLVYARGYAKDSNGDSVALNSSIKAHTDYLDEGSDDYKAIEKWLKGVDMPNNAPALEVLTSPIVIKEYDAPAYIGVPITWSDSDNELSQLLISKEASSEHTVNDSMLALEYESLLSAKLKAYSILGDRGDHNFTFSITDGLDSGILHKLPVKITSDYDVPKPSIIMPKSYLFFTDKATGMLKKLDSNGTEIDIGIINGFSQEWSTVYRRADKGWLYFVNQSEQKIYVVNETNAEVLFDIALNHEPRRVGTSHKQTLYLIWWRPAEGNVGDANYTAGGLEGLLESKLSSDPERNGDFYVGLGDGETGSTVTPEWRTKLLDGGNTLDVYVWRRATFMTKLVNGGVDRMNVLNLVTGKPKYLTDFNFTAQRVDGVDYNASTYSNVRAIVVASDGAFYGFNKDLNKLPEAFNFDPLTKIQTKVITPQWVQEYIENYLDYATPFFVIEARDANQSGVI